MQRLAGKQAVLVWCQGWRGIMTLLVLQACGITHALAQAPAMRATPVATSEQYTSTESSASSSQAGGNVEAPSYQNVPGGEMVPSIFRSTGASFPNIRTPVDYGEPLKVAGVEGRLDVSL